MSYVNSGLVVVLGALVALSACKEKPSATLAPSASALQAAKAPLRAVHFRVEPGSSKVTFLMDSPLEKIDGDASGALSGDLFVDLEDITKSTALVRVDLKQLVLYQQKRPEKAGATGYGARTKSDLQNEHARNWLQIVPLEGEVSPEQAEANRFAEFKVDRLEEATLSNVSAASGPVRSLTASARGEFRLHGRKQEKTAKVAIRIEFEGDEPTSLHVNTIEPLAIGLADFDVNPRDNAGKFVKSLTEALSSNLKGKVADQAPLMLEFSARAE